MPPHPQPTLCLLEQICHKDIYILSVLAKNAMVQQQRSRLGSGSPDGSRQRSRGAKNLELILQTDGDAQPRIRMGTETSSDGRTQERYSLVQGSDTWRQEEGELRAELPVAELLSIAKAKLRRQRVEYLAEYLQDSPGVSYVHPSAAVLQVDVAPNHSGERAGLPRRVQELRELGEVDITDVSMINGKLRLQLEPEVTVEDLEQEL